MTGIELCLEGCCRECQPEPEQLREEEATRVTGDSVDWENLEHQIMAEEESVREKVDGAGKRWRRYISVAGLISGTG